MNMTHNSPGSIRNRILFFSLLVTLLPSMGMGWFWYDISRKTTTAKVEQTLSSSSSIIEREIGLWLKERAYDLRVFSDSFVIAENVPLFEHLAAQGGAATREREAAEKKISTYLEIIFSKFRDYHCLAVLDAQGQVVAAAGPCGHLAGMALPETWRTQVEQKTYFLGDRVARNSAEDPLVLLGIPLRSKEDGRDIGFFVLEANLRAIHPLLWAAFPEDGDAPHGAVTLVERDGRIIDQIARNRQVLADQVTGEARNLLSRPGILREYRGAAGTELLGVAFPFADLPWSLVVEVGVEGVYAELIAARDRILLITGILTVLIGGMAILIARQILRPLQELTKGVRRVAQGDLEVQVPLLGSDELGMVTSMFNEMVTQLRSSREKLEELAATDPLTGLANRKQIMATLEMQMEGFRRYGTVFAVLMLDVDYFKKINDRHGHQAGDSVLVSVADILRQMLRKRDTVGRYGGEEFLVILDTTDQTHAADTADRIRRAVEEKVFSWKDGPVRITVSIGVGAIASADESPSALISRADKALYRAKEEGRNRICLAEHPDGVDVSS